MFSSASSRSIFLLQEIGGERQDGGNDHGDGRKVCRRAARRARCRSRSCGFGRQHRAHGDDGYKNGAAEFLRFHRKKYCEKRVKATLPQEIQSPTLSPETAPPWSLPLGPPTTVEDATFDSFRQHLYSTATPFFVAHF
ncbi:hypothetical protein Nepgr_021971 [Nepenthes gracilis]|uniref:Uncharacterized protein n=1 Tax=Nepenthes gracilis TaxID=150966 RepID=A0AAD3XXQ2_NEPGR|nr:hypothetical protein Nepgr_021971 [Nepenthes gracilis]